MRLHTILSALILLLNVSLPSAFADESAAADPRTQGAYTLFFDLGTLSSADLANGYGGYIQHVQTSSLTEIFRYCDNFEGEGMSGRPNLALKREKLVPLGLNDPTAFSCVDFKSDALITGRPMIELGGKAFFILKTDGWKANEGGTLLFKFAKKVPLIGSPTYKVIRLRVSRSGPGGSWKIEMLAPGGPVLSASWLQFKVATSGLGIPNRITEFTLNFQRTGQRTFDIDTLEDP